MNADFIQARKTNLNFYRFIELYAKAENNKFVLYKTAGKTLGEMRVSDRKHPSDLYIRKQDKIKAIQEVQRGFNKNLLSYVKAGKPDKVKETLVNILEETFIEPRGGSLEGVSETIDILISDYARETNIVRNLMSISFFDYTTAIHSINVMAFALTFAFYLKLSISQTKTIGLGALLHDVGKTKIDPLILTAPRKLTEEEFKKIKEHTKIGYAILNESNLEYISLAALEHHEKLDGSGYPHGKSSISELGQILAVIDCYEAMTNDDRPYRNASPPLDVLKLIRKEVDTGKFNKIIFEQFVYCLAKA